MPQLVIFPYLGSAPKPTDALIRMCRGLSADGEPRKAFRKRLKEDRIWDDDQIASTLRFFRMADGDNITASETTQVIADADDRLKAEDRLVDRLWECNPVLFKTILDLLTERLQSRDDIFIYLGSFAFRGERIPRPHYDSWMKLALALGITRQVGIGFAVGERGERFRERAVNLDLDDYFEDDEPEPEIESTFANASAVEDADAVPVAAVPATDTAAVVAAVASTAAAPECSLPSPVGHGRPVALSRFAGHAVFAEDVLEETTTRLEQWWAEQDDAESGWTAQDFGFGAELWMEGGDEALYRIAVAAAMAFRLDSHSHDETRAAFDALDKAGVLSDLYYGTAPETLPGGIDSRALMLASLVARRCAENQDLALTLEKHTTAAQVFASLDAALGRGLFRMELFWIMQVLEEIGALRLPDLADYTVMPTRVVRDSLFRLGFLETPYAHDAASLAVAAASAKRAAGVARPASSALTLFALAAGCSYGCAHRKRCDFPCRERTE